MKTNTLAAILTICAAVISSSCGSKQDQQQQQAPAPEIAVMTVNPADATIDNKFPATIKGKTDIAIRPQVSGFITKVHVDEGDHVRKGQTLFTLDQTTFQAAVDQAKAAVAAAKTQVQTAQLTANTKKQLLDKNIISPYDYQLAANDLANAKSALSQAQAALVSAQKNLSYTIVTSPSDGVVGSIPNREGSLASPSSAEPLTTISDNNQVYAYFALTEKDILNLVKGGEQTLNAAIKQMPEVKLIMADGTEFPSMGKVSTISGVIDPSTGSSNVRALFNNPNGMLRSGSTGTIVIPQSQENIIIIPQKATFEIQDKKFAYVLGDSNKVHQTPIEVLDLNDGQNFVVTSGLKSGDRIAIEGVGMTVKDGTPIQPKEAGKETQQPAAPAQKQ